MVFILGVQLPDKQITRVCGRFYVNVLSYSPFRQFALRAFYGIGHATASRICARLQIHDRARVGSLTSQQITSLASFLSAPSSSPPPPRLSLAPPGFVPTVNPRLPPPLLQPGKHRANDPLRNLRIEAELKREIRENIAHQRMIGSYVGRRHAMHLPVRGQNTRNNALTAKKLNRVERNV